MRKTARQVYFSPHGGATDAIVAVIAGAKKQLRVMAYAFDSQPIINALVAAHGRAVDVQCVFDARENMTPTCAARQLAAKLPCVFDHVHRIMHDKVIIADGTTVVTGSFNFTTLAETDHAENLLVLKDPALAALYLANWQLHHDHSLATVDPAALQPLEGP